MHYVRDVLVCAGVLPSRDEHLERITPWLDQLLAGHVRLIQPYTHWLLLHRARRKNRQWLLAGPGRYTPIQPFIVSSTWPANHHRLPAAADCADSHAIEYSSGTGTRGR